jgi:hypothetical protein
MTYFKTPNYSVALVTKAGSSTLAYAIIKQYQPAMWTTIQSADYPAGMTALDVRFHSRVARELEPTKPVVIGVRHPVERFRSACAQVRIDDVDLAIDSLENGTIIQRARPLNVQQNEHFTHQHMLQAVGGNHLFKFPQHLDQMATLLGLALPLPAVNEADMRPKPVLTPLQEQRVKDYYRKDLELFQSITAANTIVTLTEAPKAPSKQDGSGKLNVKQVALVRRTLIQMIDTILEQIIE